MDQRLQFLSSYQKEEMSLSDLCREFGVSRPTGYRWINRYKEVGPEGLLDLSRKPHGCSHATSEATENAILALRNKHPSWGARKLKARLEVLQPRVNWPAASTFGNILSRAGLTNPKQKKRRTTPYSEPFSTVTAANQLWCMDFKGYFSTGDGARCDPFTITDAHSRYLIRCQTVLRMDLNQVAAVCEAAMHEYGMPARIRTDIGVIDYAFPRKDFYRYLHRLIDAGFENRIMFGSDQMVWPEALPIAIDVIQNDPDLSDQQKRDILYNNAARFLRITH